MDDPPMNLKSGIGSAENAGGVVAKATTPLGRRAPTKAPARFGVLRRLLIWVAIFAAWEAAYRVIGWRDWVFPAPSHVIDAALRLLNIHTAFGDPLHAGWPRA